MSEAGGGWGSGGGPGSDYLGGDSARQTTGPSYPPSFTSKEMKMKSSIPPPRTTIPFPILHELSRRKPSGSNLVHLLNHTHTPRCMHATRLGMYIHKYIHTYIHTYIHSLPSDRYLSCLPVIKLDPAINLHPTTLGGFSYRPTFLPIHPPPLFLVPFLNLACGGYITRVMGGGNGIEIKTVGCVMWWSPKVLTRSG